MIRLQFLTVARNIEWKVTRGGGTWDRMGSAPMMFLRWRLSRRLWLRPIRLRLRLRSRRLSCKAKARSRSPSGMTTREARANAKYGGSSTALLAKARAASVGMTLLGWLASGVVRSVVVGSVLVG